jgi:hypothetical protein
MTIKRQFALLLGLILFVPSGGSGQLLDHLRDMPEDRVEISAVSGHEKPLAEVIAGRLTRRGLSPDVDRMSNVTVTLGSGRPRRLIVANIDEPMLRHCKEERPQRRCRSARTRRADGGCPS